MEDELEWGQSRDSGLESKLRKVKSQDEDNDGLIKTVLHYFLYDNNVGKYREVQDRFTSGSEEHTHRTTHLLVSISQVQTQLGE